MGKSPSIRRNFTFNFIKNVLFVLFPLITFPYLSRVLEPEGIGKINFSFSLVKYFILLSSLGIPLYGIREVAKIRDDKRRITILINELFQFNLIVTLFVYIVYFIFLFSNEKLLSDKTLFLITALHIIFTTIGMEWFFQGMEKYDYIAKRSIIIRVLSICLIFLFVKTKEDYLISAGISAFSMFASSIINFIFIKRHFPIRIFKKFSLKKHLKPILLIFAMNIARSIFVNLDTVMLGFMKGDEIVGYYTAALKINRIVLALITSLSVVLLPRFSYYVKKGYDNAYKKLTDKAVNFIFAVTVPSIVGILLLAGKIIFVLSGKNFASAVITMQIISPIIFFVALSNFIGVQLYSVDKEKIVLYSVIVGAIIDFSLNLLLIPLYNQNGAAIGTVCTEFVVVFIQILLGRKFLKFKLINWNRIKYIIFSLIMGLGVYFVNKISMSFFLSLILSVFSGIIIYAFLMFISRDPLIIDEIERMKNRKSYS